MDPSDAKPRKERDETDASLEAERAKTDAELAKTQTVVEADADRVVELARERAGATLGEARDRADQNMEKAGVSNAVVQGVARERKAEDRAVTDERGVADERLRVERVEQQRALSALLDLEREATDDGLVVERAHADETVATRDEFLGLVSHDLRNLLGIISGSAQMLAARAREQGEGDSEGLAHAERIQRSTARMNRLVGDLLDVVGLEAGKLRVVCEPHDALELVKEAMQAFLPSFTAKGLALTLEAPKGSIVVKFDHDRLFQVLSNLLSNAFKFTEPGGTVTLSLERVGADARFSVTDTGRGIPAARLATIFERFQQITNDSRGLGLGLYIAKCIVEAHGGTLWAENQEPHGTAMRFTIPAAR
jgi:signal transduction histidine kinase